MDATTPRPLKKRPPAAKMTPDDPRHGTYAGAVAHWQAGEKPSKVCPPCCAAGSRKRKGNQWRARQGGRGRYPRLGFARRIHALQALGWSIDAIAAQTGTLTAGQLNHVVDRRLDARHRHTGEQVNLATANAVVKVYNALSMRFPPPGPRVDAVRRNAAKNRWAPPLAWELLDIDDPNVEPWGWDVDYDKEKAKLERRIRATVAHRVPPVNACTGRVEILEEAIANGESISDVVRRTGATRAALQKWCGSRGLHHLYRTLAAREPGMLNGRGFAPRSGDEGDEAA